MTPSKIVGRNSAAYSAIISKHTNKQENHHGRHNSHRR
jgi:hypothetical protein